MQLRAMQAAAREQFVDDLARRLRSEFPARAATPEEAREAVLRAAEGARAHDLITDETIARFAACVFRLGEEFWLRDERARAIEEQPLDGVRKLALFEELR